MENFYEAEKVNKLYPEATMFKAMRVWSLPEKKVGELHEHATSGKYFAQIKKDGYWYAFNRTPHYGYLFSRTESKVTGLPSEKGQNVPHILNALCSLPAGTIVIGEIYIPNGTSSDVTKIMGCLPATAQKRLSGVDIRYYIHDIVSYNGVSMFRLGAEKRYGVLKQVFDRHLSNYDFIELAETYTENIPELITKALADGEEGVVLKHSEWTYLPGKKPAWSGIKVKKIDYADVVCMGFEDATKEYNGTELDSWEYWKDGVAVTKPYYYGWKTAIILGAYNALGELQKIGTVSSGLTDELRAKFATEPEKFIGEVVMVECMQKDNVELSLRHPRFKGFRQDKNSSECTLADVFDKN